MNIPLSASAVMRWSPDVEGGEAAQFRIKPASLIERAAFRRDIAAQGCRFPTQAELFAILRGLLADHGDEESGGFLAAIDYLEFTAETPPDAGDAEAAQQIAEAAALVEALEETLRGFENPYLRALADREHFLTVAPLIAAQRFCVGWEGAYAGADLPAFQQRNGLIPLELLEQLDPNLRTLLGFRCLDAVNLSGAARKN